jgi:dTDP-4-amino-4,6-dideoxygalactose transaminase
VQSGTAALALALMAAQALRPEVAAPEVVLPGYACPDLVAAAEHAGLRARLADIGADDPGYCLASLEAVIGPDTVAVVAVNFLGIGERLDELRTLTADRGIALVEDDAQWFPEPPAAPGLRGDLVCLSFGRGKPVSLLGGGLLLVREALSEQLGDWPRSCLRAAAPVSAPSLRAKMALYNMLLRPQLYALLSRNPLLKLGVTRFKPLAAIAPIDPVRTRLLSANVHRHLQRARDNEARARALLADHPALLDLPLQMASRTRRLLRYPLLCRDDATRDRLWERLRAEGLGATAMYQRTLPLIEGVDGRVAAGPLPGAESFARRLLTLPLHDGVGERHWQRMGEVLRAGGC